MNTREIAAEYRLSHWAGMIKRRSENGQSIRVFCESEGIHENTYYYWQRKLREAVIVDQSKQQKNLMTMPPTGFAEVKLPIEETKTAIIQSRQNQIRIEVDGLRIVADGEYPIDKLVNLFLEVARQ